MIKSVCVEKSQEWGKLELAETKIGRIEHKIEKLTGMPGLPGVDWLAPLGMSGDHGIAMEDNAPFGVILAVTPVTHSIPTIASNIISMVAAGNTLVVNAHPGGARCAATAVAFFNEVIERAVGVRNVVTIVETPTLESFNALCQSEHVKLICVTGGPMVVKAAMRSGKRAICAGPGNPPVVIDETADLDKAARAIILGGAYDNNLLCIGEKQVFVLDGVYNAFLSAFEKAGAVKLTSGELERLKQAAFTVKDDPAHPLVNRDFVGADASRLAEVAGRRIDAKTEMIFAETDARDPFVTVEQMMPMLPVVRMKTIDEAIQAAIESEHGYNHSAMIHSMNLKNITRMSREMETTLFVKNGPCVAGLGMGGEGYANFSIATTTGEGIVTPTTFTRRRRCVMVDQLNII